VDIWQFNAEGEALIVDLRALNETASAVEVETAIRSGAGQLLARFLAGCVSRCAPSPLGFRRSPNALDS
jgi:hypothetical protein